MGGSLVASLVVTYTHIYIEDGSSVLSELGELKYATAVAKFSASGTPQTPFTRGTTVLIGANARRGKYGLGNVSWVNITNGGKLVFSKGSIHS